MGWRCGPLIGVTINCRTLPQLTKAALILAKQGAPMDQGQQKRAASVKKGNKKGNEVRMRPTRQFLATQRGRVCLWAAVSPCQSACGFLRPGRWAGIRTSSDAAGGVTRPARFSRPWFPTDRGCLSKPARTSRLSVAKYSPRQAVLVCMWCGGGLRVSEGDRVLQCEMCVSLPIDRACCRSGCT